MVTPMLRPDLFGGFATHAGDALFEVCYEPDFRESARALRDNYDGSFDTFWRDFRSRPAFSKNSDYPLVNTYAMAACYSANADGTIDLPFVAETGELVPDVWERWLAWDPVRMVDRYADALRSQRAIYIDSGKSDQFFLDLGAEAFRARSSASASRCVLRAVRRDAHVDRVPLPPRSAVPRRTIVVSRMSRHGEVAPRDAPLHLRQHLAAVLGRRPPAMPLVMRRVRDGLDRPDVRSQRSQHR
jgi:hypothetical protein